MVDREAAMASLAVDHFIHSHAKVDRVNSTLY